MSEPLKSFFVERGRCFRMVRDPVPEHRGHTIHCPEPVVTRGRFRAESKKVYTVDACAEHAEGLPPLSLCHWRLPRQERPK